MKLSPEAVTKLSSVAAEDLMDQVESHISARQSVFRELSDDAYEALRDHLQVGIVGVLGEMDLPRR